MSTATCPACGALLDELAARCPECGEKIRGRKRGELAGVRIDPDRLERVLPDLDLDSPSRRWGRPSERPADGSDEQPRSDARASWAPPPPPASAAASATDRNSTPDGLQNPVAEPLERKTPTSSPPPPLERKTPISSPPPPLAPPPLDAEVVVLFPAAQPAPTAPKPRTAAADGRTGPAAHVRPPVLASEALLRDLAPAKPAPRALRYASATLGLIGVGVVALMTGNHGAGVPFSAAFAALVLLSLPPMPYAARAVSVITVAGGGLVLVLSTNMNHVTRDEELVLTMAVTLLATGLYFRAFHRASLLARVLVVLGVLVGVAFLEMSGALRHLTMVDTAWQSWAPRLLSLPFGLLLMLSLLAFMDARTTAGCGVWATCVLLFHGSHAVLQLLRAAWPKGAQDADFARIAPNVALAWLCTPVFTALLALGLAQMLATTIASAAPARTRNSQRPT